MNGDDPRPAGLDLGAGEILEHDVWDYRKGEGNGRWMTQERTSARRAQ
jgi:hypothetical protein